MALPSGAELHDSYFSDRRVKSIADDNPNINLSRRWRFGLTTPTFPHLPLPQVVLTEEALAGDNLHRLSLMLRTQPPWSDVPVIVLTRDGTASSVATYALDMLDNVMILDRPVRVATLVSAARTALRRSSRWALRPPRPHRTEK